MTDIVLPPASASVQPASSQSPASLTLPPGYVYPGVSQEIVPVLHEFGLNPEPLIRAAGLDPRLFADGTSVIPFAALGRLYALCGTRTNCPHFGLLVGRRASILSLGLVGRLMQHADTVGDAMRALVAHLSLHDRAVAPALMLSDGMALLTFATYQAESAGVQQVLDAALGVTVNILRSLCGANWHPTEALVPRAAPAETEPYRRHFRAPVRFNQEIATLVFRARDLGLRIAGADPILWAMLEERIQQLKGVQGSEFSDDIRRLLRTRIMSRRCSAEDIAELLTMHRRTLSRRLKDSGQGYRSMTNETRFEIARQLLEDTDVSLGQIAAALGYSEASAFTRAFRRWSGQTPSAWRSESHG
ncbi:AraC family transcriptional regulator [Microvirga lotononidis]|uniref:DNA-binding domain-containing protein, AraC-type n=1 Tax=Microvirga lotononidis TaxID=864069 RepID=I4YS71_9HYPH|nr:AraC family transcriptional regulator [Microvirga lotononidis]EIM26813.1 DNA-binding domain-containing protein, AraC-type [Microvirga lotononidis]WQO31715.1 AraC family transcriptional regulator [Microvirga lotononidis]